MSPTPPAEAPATAAALVSIRRRFVALTALRWLPTGFVVPVTVLLLRERGLDLPTIGLIVAVYSAATLVLELPTGGLADVIGRRPVLATAALVAAVSSLTLAFGRGALVLALGYLLGGIARALDSGPLQAWFVDRTHEVDPDASLRTGLSRAGVAESVALAAGALAGGGLVAISPLPTSGDGLVALSTPFLVAAALSVLHAVLVLVWVRDPARPADAPSPGTRRGLGETIAAGLRLARTHPALRRILLLTAAVGAALSGLELLAPPRFAALLGGESAAAGAYAVLVTAGFLGSASGSALAPAVARLTRGPSRAALVGVLGAAVALAAVALPAPLAAAVAFVAFYVLLGIAVPLVEELTHAAASSAQRATVLSLNSMAMQGTAIVTTAGLGVLAGATSSAAALWLPAAVLAIGALALARWPRLS
ncbi:MFS transporter [Demequina maris]|uniref:MFS transporter n=1 Tax=Demequina maris TaxID=1638982 RepID=UPI000784B418|nr:MFS transporter [Demequina maris]